MACGLGLAAALVTFQYAVGFYASAGARHLAKGAAGYALYHLLFVLTLALVPVFSLFEVVAMLVAACVAPRFRSGEAARREEEEGRGYRRSAGPGRVRLPGGVRALGRPPRRVRRRGSTRAKQERRRWFARVSALGGGGGGPDRRRERRSQGGGARGGARVRADRAAAEKAAEKAEKGDFVAVGGVGVEIERTRRRDRRGSGRGDGPRRGPGRGPRGAPGGRPTKIDGSGAPPRQSSPGRGGDDGDPRETRTRETRAPSGDANEGTERTARRGYISHRIVVCDEKMNEPSVAFVRARGDVPRARLLNALLSTRHSSVLARWVTRWSSRARRTFGSAA